MRVDHPRQPLLMAGHFEKDAHTAMLLEDSSKYGAFSKLVFEQNIYMFALFQAHILKESSAKALSAFLPTGFLFSQVGDCTRLYSEEETLQFPLLFISSLTALQLLQYSVQTWSCTSLDQMSIVQFKKI